MLPTLKLETFDLNSLISNDGAVKSLYDAVVMVGNEFDSDSAPFSGIFREAALIDASLKTSSVSLVFHEKAPGSRVIFARTGCSIIGDTDDVRIFYDLGKLVALRLLSAGAVKPLLCFSAIPVKDRKGNPHGDFKYFIESFILGIFQQIYEPLQTREHKSNGTNSDKCLSFSSIGVMTDLKNIDLHSVLAVEHGRILARDVGGSDPERMTPLNCASFILDSFKDCPNIHVSVEKDCHVLAREFPLLYAVARCSLAVPRHFPCVVKLEYRSPNADSVRENLFLVGKGVTYDTGGADIKAGGVMRGMSRDKCGASACAGFMKTLSLLAPKHVNVTAYLGFVRNSVGADSFVSDEIIKSRAGVRCLIGNTDAEGRLVMCDLLAKSKEEALLIPGSSMDGSAPARLFTIATLTGHAVRAVGPYACCLDNGPAKEAGMASRIARAGLLLADPVEITTLRREDYRFVSPGSSAEDVVQANDKASSATSRGHQFPMAFLAIASGIKEHGLNSKHPLCYTHLDIAGSAEEPGSVGLSLPKVTGAPISALTSAFLF